jgi:hypothetical protein
MYPFMSAYPYLNMMGSLGRRTTSPWDDPTSTTTPGFGGPVNAQAQAPWSTPTSSNSTGGGWASKPGLGQGLTALGASLLESAGRGDFAGGLARGAQGFGEAITAGAERRRQQEMQDREEARRAAAEGREVEREADRNRADDLNHERGNAELDAWREQQARGQEARTRTGKSAEQMVAEIDALASRNPNDPKLQVMSRRAAGYALGEESDLNKLADLHEQMTAQAFYDEDVDRKTSAEIRSKKEMYGAGVEVNPVEESRRDNARADAGLAISREHLNLSKDRANQEKEGLTDLQAYDRLEKKVKEKLDARVRAQYESTGRAATPAQMQQWRTQALQESMTEMQQRVGQVYQFTRDGRFVLGDEP